MRVVNYYLITLFMFLISGISRILSIKLRGKLGEFFGTLMMKANKKRQTITKKNLKLAFPDKNDEWIDDICKKSYWNLGITLVELLAFTKYNKDNIHKYLKIENPELFFENINKNKGIILLASHFTNWEILAYGGGIILDKSFLIIVLEQKNYVSDRVLNSIRTFHGNRVISMTQAAREIIKEIKNNGVLALLADQSATADKDVYVDFFGHPTSFYKSTAELALRFRTPVLIPTIIRNKDYTYTVKILELDFSDLNYDKDGTKEFTQRYAKILEKMASDNPEFWAWQHKKWKHTFNNLY
jgi:KDO2-lipid IV(A) lauroyltransferase